MRPKKGQPRKRNFSSEDLRQDIVELSRIIGKDRFLLSALVKTLRYWKPERYKNLHETAVLYCTKKEAPVRTKWENQRWWVLVTRIVQPRVEAKTKRPRQVKCRHCGTYCNYTRTWQLGRTEVHEYLCDRCGTVNRVYKANK